MKSTLFAACAALSLLAAPVALCAQNPEAQAEDVMIDDAVASDEPDELTQAMAMLGAMFPAEPLTAEQEARLPQAQRIINRMIPDGTLSEMMGSMFDKMLGPIMQMGGSAATTTVTAATGLSTYDLDLTPEQTEELAGLFDPAWAVRQEREMAMLPDMMTQMMDAMEPGMRKAMAELYAINFNPTELAEIEAFFLTETGTNYARKSFTMSSDPRVLSATMEAMPAMMGTIGSIEQKLAEATADLPAKRNFADLAPAEQARVAELTGYAVEEIEANLYATEEASWEAMDAADAAADEAAAEADAE
ncbi:hypothetical protein [Porphyrobacter sp. AAP60]|uniref:hypothetical protein n=1 Tax=Porphyrobacter sp. AAP60 TaxID=1523423 RepID=UPI0006B8B577|nr:hypothetical protein [Porphyrobacter sp. AAP60]KPF63625.1 hypothetical protein IP79_06895 [Porphyrobacter sp. AAP60]